MKKPECMDVMECKFRSKHSTNYITRMHELCNQCWCPYCMYDVCIHILYVTLQKSLNGTLKVNLPSNTRGRLLVKFRN